MDAIGNEVGQKMRSAIKAKLMELGCYVDDELPDYIMVMVANKRTRSQMESDLQLFLRLHTEEFVDWLQQVLKKLKEVRLTNPELYACTSFGELKRKASIEMAECVVKKEKKDKRIKLEKDDSSTITTKLLSDDIPVTANKLVECLGNKIRNSNSDSRDGIKSSTSRRVVQEDSFDIPSISEVNMLEDSELEVVADKIKKAKLVLMKSDSEDEDFINIKADAEELLANELCDISSSTIVTESGLKDSSQKQTISLNRARNVISNSSINKITESKPNHMNYTDLRHSLNNKSNSTKISARLGEKADSSEPAKRTISLAESIREEKEMSGRIFGSIVSKPVEKPVKKSIVLKRDGRGKKEGIKSRLGLPASVVSVVSLPNKRKETVREREPKQLPEPVTKSVPSMVKVKPRKPTSSGCQANKTLLLRAVAEAQRSIAQIPPRGSENKKALFTKKYQEQLMHYSEKTCEPTDKKTTDITSDIIKNRHKNIRIEVQRTPKKEDVNITNEDCDENSSEYVPTPLKSTDETNEDSEYVPSLELTYDEDLDKYMDDLESSNETNSNSVSESNIEEQEITESQTKHQFIVTLDGLKDNLPFKRKGSASPTSTTNIGDSPKTKRPPSPIVFKKEEAKTTVKVTRVIPETLPKVNVIKERCKYWPACRLGDNCEYMHPNMPCKMFPNCKFGDRCLYIHPKCKFYASCTRKDCPYSHGIPKTILKTVIKQHLPYTPYPPAPPEVCKFFPNCTNLKCSFYHPKPCRFGVACLNKAECGFSHNLPSKEKLTWHSVK